MKINIQRIVNSGVSIQGKGNLTISGNGKNISVSGGDIAINGVKHSSLSEKQITIIINGNPDSVSCENGDITVNGDVSGNVKSQNGNIVCKNVSGKVSTENGNITYSK